MLVERIIFMQTDYDAEEPLRILDESGESAAMEYLKQWHYPGEHETSDSWSKGTSDDYYRNGRYMLSYNLGLGYIGLEYRVE